ncbi:hypothetical protein RJT34_30327 [Clitoria ternatea]|uniref:Transmembrane protein n=1 Tax=Clitoria ternatea TaxID=43366 RepID=A0AAN9I1V8_CLITE
MEMHTSSPPHSSDLWFDVEGPFFSGVKRRRPFPFSPSISTFLSLLVFLFLFPLPVILFPYPSGDPLQVSIASFFHIFLSMNIKCESVRICAFRMVMCE